RYCGIDIPELHSCPTRRSSDLTARPAPGGAGTGSAGPRARGGFASDTEGEARAEKRRTQRRREAAGGPGTGAISVARGWIATPIDRKSTRLNSSHVKISYAVFC